MNEIEWPVGEPIKIPTSKFFGLLFLGSMVWGTLIALVCLFAIYHGAGSIMVPISECNAQVDNATNQSFINGSIYGFQATLEAITNRSIACDPTPITSPGLNYTLIPIECLNMSGAQNG